MGDAIPAAQRQHARHAKPDAAHRAVLTPFEFTYWGWPELRRLTAWQCSVVSCYCVLFCLQLSIDKQPFFDGDKNKKPVVAKSGMLPHCYCHPGSRVPGTPAPASVVPCVALELID